MHLGRAILVIISFMLAWSHGHAHGRMSAETAAKEQQPSSSESLVFASVVHRKLPTTTSPTLAPTYLTLIGVTLPITQRLTTSMSKSYFLHSDALVKFRDGVASGLGTMPNGRPYTREYVIVKSVLEIVAGRRLASASVLTSSSFSLEHSLLQHLHLRRRLPTTTVIALDISYTVQMDIANQEVRYIYTSSFLSTFVSFNNLIHGSFYSQSITNSLVASSPDYISYEMIALVPQGPTDINVLSVQVISGIPTQQPTNLPSTAPVDISWVIHTAVGLEIIGILMVIVIICIGLLNTCSKRYAKIAHHTPLLVEEPHTNANEGAISSSNRNDVVNTADMRLPEKVCVVEVVQPPPKKKHLLTNLVQRVSTIDRRYGQEALILADVRAVLSDHPILFVSRAANNSEEIFAYQYTRVCTADADVEDKDGSDITKAVSVSVSAPPTTVTAVIPPMKKEVDDLLLQRLCNFYQYWSINHKDKAIQARAKDKFNDKVTMLEALKKYKGREEKMFAVLGKTYGPEQPISVPAVGSLQIEELETKSANNTEKEKNKEKEKDLPLLCVKMKCYRRAYGLVGQGGEEASMTGPTIIDSSHVLEQQDEEKSKYKYLISSAENHERDYPLVAEMDIPIFVAKMNKISKGDSTTSHGLSSLGPGFATSTATSNKGQIVGAFRVQMMPHVIFDLWHANVPVSAYDFGSDDEDEDAKGDQKAEIGRGKCKHHHRKHGVSWVTTTIDGASFAVVECLYVKQEDIANDMIEEVEIVGRHSTKLNVLMEVFYM